MNDSLIVRTVKQILSWQVEPFSNASRRRSQLKVAHIARSATTSNSQLGFCLRDILNFHRVLTANFCCMLPPS